VEERTVVFPELVGVPEVVVKEVVVKEEAVKAGVPAEEVPEAVEKKPVEVPERDLSRSRPRLR
jgi:hypothetical protein